MKAAPPTLVWRPLPDKPPSAYQIGRAVVGSRRVEIVVTPGRNGLCVSINGAAFIQGRTMRMCKSAVEHVIRHCPHSVS